ncbi:MAG: cell division protein FtsA, partial [Polyangia bacterium]
FARTLSRGSADVTLTLADTYRLEPAAAERAKHTQAQLLPEDLDQIIDPARRKLDSVLRDALRPLLRDLRQTFSAARSQGEPQPQRLVLVGGGAKLNGFPDYLSRELGLPLAELAVSTELLSPEVAAEVAELPSVALGMAFGVGLSTGSQVNLRKGTLVFHNDYSYLRGKASSLAVGAVVLLACLGLNAYASLHAMHKESDVLQARLRVETAELFGTSKTDGKAVTEELRRGPQNGSPPVPSMTAFDVLDEITARLPPKDQLTLDILELDIKPKKTFIKAMAGSAKEIEALVEALNQIDCFTDIQKGQIASIPGPATDGGTPVELKQFTLTIETTCP